MIMILIFKIPREAVLSSTCTSLLLLGIPFLSWLLCCYHLPMFPSLLTEKKNKWNEVTLNIGVQIRGKEQENRSPSQSQSHNIRVRDTGRQQVVLLAGPHKTASSSIQRNLFHWLNGMTTDMLLVYPKNGPGLHHRKHSEKTDALWRAILKSSKFSIG